MALLLVPLPVLASAPVLSNTGSFNVGSVVAGLGTAIGKTDQPVRSWFELSTDASLAGAQRVGESTDPPTWTGRAKNASLSGLKPGTKYYFRACAKNNDGTTCSPILSFTTSSAPAKAPSVTYSGVDVGVASIMVNFAYSGHGLGGRFIARWSRSADMSGAITFSDTGFSAGPTDGTMHPTINTAGLPDKTTIYIQGYVVTSAGEAKTQIASFVVRTAPL